jgi:hypothetical protein
LSLRDFLDLSRFVTGKPDLPEAAGQRLLALYRSDPGRLGRLSELQRQIAAPKRGEAASASFDSWMQTARPAEVKLVAMQLLEQWYTGVYRDDRQVLVVSYEDALMYRPCAGVHPVPTRCGGDTGFWSKPPKGAPEAPVGLPDPLPDRRG